MDLTLAKKCKLRGIQLFQDDELLKAFYFFSQAEDLLKFLTFTEKMGLETEVREWVSATTNLLEDKHQFKLWATQAMINTPEYNEWYSEDKDDDDKNVSVGLCLSLLGKQQRRVGESIMAFYCLQRSNFYMQKFSSNNPNDENIVPLAQSNVKELRTLGEVLAIELTSWRRQSPDVVEHGRRIPESFIHDFERDIEFFKDMDHSETRYSWNSVAGMEELKEILHARVVTPCRHESLFTFFKAANILLFGPNGSGKSLLPRVMAYEAQMNFLCPSISSVLRSTPKQTGEKLEAAFLAAARNPPCLLFFDYADFFLMDKQNPNYDYSLIRESFRACMKSKEKSTVIIAATDIPWNLHESVLEFFPLRYCTELPNRKTRAELFKFFLNKCDRIFCADLFCDSDFDKFASRTVKYAYDDIERAVDNVGSILFANAMRAPHFLEQDVNGETKYLPCFCSDPAHGVKYDAEADDRYRLVLPKARPIDVMTSLTTWLPTLPSKETLEKIQEYDSKFGTKQANLRCTTDDQVVYQRSFLEEIVIGITDLLC